MKTALFLLFIAVAASAATPEQAIRAAETVWSKAVVAGDIEALDRVLADGLVYGHSTGAEDNKESYLGKFKSGATKYASFKYDAEPHVTVYGDMSILVATAVSTTIANGKENPTHLRFLHVYKLSGGRWQLLAHQSTRLP